MAGTPYRIMVVDDGEGLAARLVDTLRRYHDLIVAADGFEAVELAVLAEPDLVVLSSRATLMDGFESCRALRGRRGADKSQIFIYIPLNDRLAAQKAFESGANQTLALPADPERLLRLMRVNLSLAGPPKVKTHDLEKLRAQFKRRNASAGVYSAANGDANAIAPSPTPPPTPAANVISHPEDSRPRPRDAAPGSLAEYARVFDANPAMAGVLLPALERLLRGQKGLTPGGEFLRGRMLLALGRYDDARESLQAALNRDPDNDEILIELNKAIRKLKSAPAPDMAPSESPLRRGEAWFARGDYEKAVPAFQEAVRDPELRSTAYRRLAACFLHMDMLNLAFEDLLQAEPDAETKELMYDLARRFEEKSNPQSAKHAYRTLLGMDPRFRDVAERLEALAATTANTEDSEPSATGEAGGAGHGVGERRFEFLEEVGRGAIGRVYRAFDRELDEIVAVKVLSRAYASDSQMLLKLKAEARSARRLAHHNIVRIHDFNEEQGRKFISMEFIQGEDLRQYLKREERMEMRLLIKIARQVGRALAYSHARGVVHRDIKPANIMLTETGRAMITDFGIAGFLEAQSRTTAAGRAGGTPLYMAPEQILGAAVDGRCDQYSLAVMLYEMFCGHTPFHGKDVKEKHVNNPPPPMDDCPPEFWAVLERCLRKDPKERYPNMNALVAALGKAVSVKQGA